MPVIFKHSKKKEASIQSHGDILHIIFSSFLSCQDFVFDARPYFVLNVHMLTVVRLGSCFIHLGLAFHLHFHNGIIHVTWLKWTNFILEVLAAFTFSVYVCFNPRLHLR